MKFGEINDHFEMGDVMITTHFKDKFFFNSHFLTEENGFCLNTASTRLINFKKFHFLEIR